jgi:hypothetical protein
MFLLRHRQKVSEEGDKSGTGVLSERKMEGIEKDLHNASSGGLLIKNQACNNTRC